MLKLRASRATGRRLGAALACALLALLTVAGPAVGASITFGTASATSSFGNGIDFTQPYSGGTIKSASILITTPDAVGPTIVAIDQAGSSSLTFTMDTSNGQLDPFSPIVAKFEVVLTDGTTLDGPDIHVIYADDRFKWQTKTGKIVRLHYVDASSSFASQMLSLADGGVANSSALFGVSETKPIDFYVYPSQEAFQQGLSEPGTIGGVAMPSYRTCFAIVEPGDYTYAAQVMPHEPTHIVFADATGNPYHDPPRWLNEGFTQYVSQGYDSNSRQLVTQAARDGTLPSLLALTEYFPLDADRIYLAYAESVGAVDFMIRKYGKPAILKLVQAYKKGDSDDEAFTAGLGVNVATFDSAFLADNHATSTKYGPQPAPTGAVPPGWSESGTGPGATPQPTGANGPGASNGTSTPHQAATGHSGDPVILLLAGIMAVAGVILLCISGVMLMTPHGQTTR
jgi:hypothetical protein